MKEITRIHIAKVAYDSELDAKKDLEKYIKALELYAGDQEILADIEIRITELLAEQGVAAGDVITVAEVAAIRAQLGEPVEFASDDIAANQVEEAVMPKRVYRDENDAILGGVLAGFSKFLGVDPLWVRLAFIVVLFASFGTALLIYIILWIIIPPARSAAEKLQMNGQTVTLASIKQLAGSDEQRSERSQAVQRILSIVAGSFLVLIAISGLIAIIAVLFGVQFGFGPGEIVPVDDKWVYSTWWFMTAMGLFVLSGLLFSTLCFILANAAFRRTWTKRIGIAVIAVVTAGLVVFASGIGTGFYGIGSEQNRIMTVHQNTSGAVPENFKNITSFIFEDTGFEGWMPVQYIVSDNPRYELDAFPGVEPRFEIAADGLSAKVKLVKANGTSWTPFGSLGYGMTVLRVYGPELDMVTVRSNGSPVSYHNEQGQEMLAVRIEKGSGFSLEGRYASVSVEADTAAPVSLEDALIGELSVVGGVVDAGVVRALNVTQTDICTGDQSKGYGLYDQEVRVRGISSDEFIYNGENQPIKSISNNCGSVVVGDEVDEL